MKAVVLITENIAQKAQWQFDQVMALIAYDVAVNVIFINSGCEQVVHNNAWKCLAMYGVEDVFIMSEDNSFCEKALFKVNKINNNDVLRIIKQAEVIL